MRSRCTWVVLLVAASAALVAGCERTPLDVLLPNQSPRITLSAGPIRDSTNVFIATFNWNASDDDGEVVLFRYAINDTSSAGAWFETRDFEITLFFAAPDSSRIDSIVDPLLPLPEERYVFDGMHTFFVKAVDNEGAESPPASLSFTSETIAPQSRVLNPNPSSIVSLGRTFTVNWEGTDLDGTEPPPAFSWRLVQVASIVTMSHAQIEEALLDTTASNPWAIGDPTQWSPFEPRTSVQLKELAVPAQYLLGVRAIDQAGAVEPRMRLGIQPVNVLRIRADEQGGRPNMKISSAVRTTTYPTADERAKTFQIPANTDVLFTWEADATQYGGNISGYSYGLDLDDLAEGNPGWQPESANLTQVRLNFLIPEGGGTEEHILFVRARDDVGTLVIADANLIVVPITRERDVLYVDDWFGEDFRGRGHPELGRPCITVSEGGLIPDGQVTNVDRPHDICHDAYLRESLESALAGIGRDDWIVDQYEPLSKINGSVLVSSVSIDSTRTNEDGERYWIYNGPVTLEQLARYKVVVWNHRNDQDSQWSTMNKEGESNFLAVFLAAGGNAWLSGSGVFHRARVTGPFPLYGYEDEDFAFQFLKIRSAFDGVDCADGCFQTGTRNPLDALTHGFEGAYASPRASAEGFPDLRYTRDPFANNPIKGFPETEAMIVPHGLDINPRLALFGGRLDTLYFYQSNALLERNSASFMDDGATGLRYQGPDQGKLMMFGFPFFWLPEGELEGMMRSGLSWFLDGS